MDNSLLAVRDINHKYIVVKKEGIFIMSSSFNPYNYDTKEQVEDHLGIDLMDMLICIEKNGYIIQEQFEKLDAYLCESYANMIIDILSDRTGKNIFYVFVTPCCFYSFFDTEMVDRDYVEEKTREFAHKRYGI